MTSCCACCCFYPKYKRKVDNIYPRSYDAPLVKNEVDKLIYYATVHPEKLSKIGDYLYQNLKWGLNNRYKYAKYVDNTIEAVEKILIAINTQNLNYYAPNYLKIIQKLLEQGYGSSPSSPNIQNMVQTSPAMTNAPSYGALNHINNDNLHYQKKAAGLFQKFCEKDSSNLSNNLNFDQFVSQFSSMCFNSNKDENIRAEIRSSGLQCLATMVRRLVPDDNLRASYIWDNMDKIISGVLYIIHEQYLIKSKNSRSLDKSDYDYQEDEEELSIYIYGDLYINSKLNKSVEILSQETKNPELKIQYNKKSKNNADMVDEENVVISLNDNKVNNNNESVTFDPEHEAKMLLKNICSKADYTTINKIVVPILAFLDDNRPNGWELTKFVRCIFLIVIYNVKQQHAFVVKELLKHLDSHRNSSAILKCQIIRTIILCTKISAMQSVGTTGQIIDIFNNLLKHMNSSVEKSYNLKSVKSVSSPSSENLNDENKLQKEIISAMRQFTANMPDYAKNDILVFFARQINSQQFSYFELTNNNTQHNELELLNNQKRSKYYECLYEICTKYKPSQLFSAFGSIQFLEDSLKLILVNDWSSRKKAHEILQLLFDKYQLIEKIQNLKPSLFRVVPVHKNFKNSTLTLNDSTLSLNNNNKKNEAHKSSQLSLTRNQTFLSQFSLNDKSKFSSSRDDVMFMRKHGRTILSHFNEYLFLANNRRENFETAYITLSLILIGLFNENEFLVDLIRFGFHLQDLALLNYNTENFSFSLQCSIHKFICAYFLLVSKSSKISEFYNYVSEICDLRRRKDLFKFVYPEYILLESASDSGVHSQVGTFNEIEAEIKKEINESSKEYSNYVSKLSRKSDNEIEWNLNLAPWLFEKKKIEEILINSNIQLSKSLFCTDNEFTLSVSYLQTVSSFQSVLKYRNPFSNECESPNSNRQNGDFIPGHQRVYSAIGVSPSTHFNQTPRRSIDADSVDDDTSYDSTSQISVDQVDFDTQGNNFFIEVQNHDPQATVRSINILKNTDITSFDTIRKVLFNSGSNINASNLSNSGVGLGSSTIGPGSSIVQNINNFNSLMLSNVQDDQQDEENKKIIIDTLQKPFDELKQRINQQKISSEKYQQVFDHVSKGLNYSNTEPNQDINNTSRSNASVSSMSTNNSIQSNYLKMDNLTKPLALNDIEFPHLFIN
ncbi:unnamed protein product [Brachionus calyciflorus]|uniref:Protein EFR3 n=1 Tax=Brachionus calyciflorus TaxID=104777 RepID=A0A813MZ85_9BILA|nr:unnamed protein product [Brachionus calyciflorus]